MTNTLTHLEKHPSTEGSSGTKSGHSPTILLGSRPADTVDVFDWRHDLSMAINSFAESANKIAEALNEGGEKASYIRSNARQFGEPLPLQLVCSIWMVMEGLGTIPTERAGSSFSTRAPEQGAEDRHLLFKTGDPDAPEVIKDRNGEVVLEQCRRCGKAERELHLDQPCRPTLQAAE